MQLRPGIVLAVVAVATPAWADDAVDFTTTWYQEQRKGGLGGLTVVHPQLDIGADIGESFTLDLGYAADAVTGATATVYSVDAVSSATTFDDLRHEARLGMSLAGKRSTFGIGASASVERDYLSIAITGGGSIDLPGRNTNIALSYTHNFDQVCDRDNADLVPLERRALTGFDNCERESYIVRGVDDTMAATVWRDLSIDTTQATVTQNLTPTSNLQLSLYGQVVHGFQSNPYRRVRVGPNEPQEHLPDVRARLAVAARWNRFFPSLRGAVHASARYYSDTWGINSGSGELAWSQYAGTGLLLRVRARIHQQTPATFFKDAFFYETEGSAREFFTGDRELAPVRNIVLGAKMTLISAAEDDKDVWGLFDKLQLNLKADLYLLDELAADDPAANPAGTDNQFLSSGQFLDAFVLGLGLLANY